VLDMATGQISMGKVLDHAERGIPLPAGAAVDDRGLPTTDPAAAARGAISPVGGPKGYALAVVLEALVATLTGTALGQEVHGTLDDTRPCTKGDVLIALDLAAFGSRGGAALQDYLAELRSAEPASGHQGVAIPGDRARSLRARYLADGVPVAEITWRRAEQILAEVSRRPGGGPHRPAQPAAAEGQERQ
jgi:L-2-hydroxycarboxylate dehydrogenase (NAD+)